ncbi:MAG: septum site-determining protein MinC [Solirubrobacterales bacterium]
MAAIDIKGSKNAYVFNFKEGNLQDYLAFLTERFEKNAAIFAGSAVNFKGDGLKALSVQDMASVQRLCLDHGMVINAVPPAPTVKTAAAKTAPARSAVRETADAGDLILRRTLRSGQRVTHDGSVVVIGDVHESAEVFAGKDVIVLGTLEGIVHAGCMGDVNSIVFALNLFPRQIRIADKISQPPKDYTRNRVAEFAFIEGDDIFIREYPPRGRNSK